MLAAQQEGKLFLKKFVVFSEKNFKYPFQIFDPPRKYVGAKSSACCKYRRTVSVRKTEIR